MAGVVGCVGSLPRCFSLFNFLCLLASSVSDFCLDTGRAVVAHCWGEGCCKLILLACACSISSTLGLPLLMMHTTQTLHCSTREPSEAGPRLHAPPQSKPLRLGTQEALRGTDLVRPAFCALPRSEQLRSLPSAVAVTYGLSLLLSVLGVPLAPLVSWMVTGQDPKKS